MKELENLLDKYSQLLNYVHFDLTHRCNLRCAHCCILLEKSLRKELVLSEVKDALNQISDLGCMKLILSGGEVLMRKDFPSVLSYAFKKGFSVLMLTNATLLTPSIADLLVDKPISIQVSLYGSNAKLHDCITSVKGSFKKTMKSFTLLKQRRVRFRIAYTIMKQNQHDIEDMYDLAQRLEMDVSYNLSIHRRFDRNLAPTKLRLSDQEMIEVFNKKPLRRHFKRTPFFGPEKRAYKIRALIGPPHCFIDPQGRVYPDLFSEQITGYLKKKCLRSIWFNSPIFNQRRSLRSRYTKFECYFCKYFNMCCFYVGEAELEYGDIFKHPEERCRIIKNFLTSSLKRKKVIFPP